MSPRPSSAGHGNEPRSAQWLDASKALFGRVIDTPGVLHQLFAAPHKRIAIIESGHATLGRPRNRIESAQRPPWFGGLPCADADTAIRTTVITLQLLKDYMAARISAKRASQCPGIARTPTIPATRGQPKRIATAHQGRYAKLLIPRESCRVTIRVRPLWGKSYPARKVLWQMRSGDEVACGRAVCRDRTA